MDGAISTELMRSLAGDASKAHRAARNRMMVEQPSGCPRYSGLPVRSTTSAASGRGRYRDWHGSTWP